MTTTRTRRQGHRWRPPTPDEVDADLRSGRRRPGARHAERHGAALTYTPAANYNGPDSFTFKANDGTVDSNVATVSITVTAVNDAPVANAQAVTTDEDTAKAITLSGDRRRGSALTYTVVVAGRRTAR